MAVEKYWRAAELSRNEAGVAYHRLGDNAIGTNLSNDDPIMHMVAAHEALHVIQAVGTTWGFAKLQLAAMELTYLKGLFSDSPRLAAEVRDAQVFPSYVDLHRLASQIGGAQLVRNLEQARYAYALSRLLDSEALDDAWLTDARQGWSLLTAPNHWETSGLVVQQRQHPMHIEKQRMRWKHSPPKSSKLRVGHLLEGAACIAERMYLDHLRQGGVLTAQDVDYCQQGIAHMERLDIYTRAYEMWQSSRRTRDDASDKTFLVAIDLALNPNVCVSLRLPDDRVADIEQTLPCPRFERICEVTSDMDPVPLNNIPAAVDWLHEVCRKAGWQSLYDLAVRCWNLRNYRRSADASHGMVVARSRAPEGECTALDLWKFATTPVPYSFGHGRFVMFLEAFATRATHPFAFQFGFTQDTAEAILHNKSSGGLMIPGLVVFRDKYRLFSMDALKCTIHRMVLDSVRHLLYVDSDPLPLTELREPFDEDLFPEAMLSLVINSFAGCQLYK